MRNQIFFGISADAWAIFVVAVIIGGVGLYTDNSGFTMAGVIALVVSLTLVLQQVRKKN
jgi:hypothetical protein